MTSITPASTRSRTASCSSRAWSVVRRPWPTMAETRFSSSCSASREADHLAVLADGDRVGA
jgi:hypothetical protein